MPVDTYRETDDVLIDAAIVDAIYECRNDNATMGDTGKYARRFLAQRGFEIVRTSAAKDADHDPA